MDSSNAFVATPAPEALPLSVKLAFGAPSFAGAAMAIPIGVLMPRFHSLRLGPARRMMRDPLPGAVIRVHLEEEVEKMRSDSRSAAPR